MGLSRKNIGCLEIRLWRLDPLIAIMWNWTSSPPLLKNLSSNIREVVMNGGIISGGLILSSSNNKNLLLISRLVMILTILGVLLSINNNSLNLILRSNRVKNRMILLIILMGILTLIEKRRVRKLLINWLGSRILRRKKRVF